MQLPTGEASQNWCRLSGRVNQLATTRLPDRHRRQ